jgi:hypothetical protein
MQQLRRVAGLGFTDRINDRPQVRTALTRSRMTVKPKKFHAFQNLLSEGRSSAH